MAPTRITTRASSATTTTTTPITNAQLKALIDQGVADALVARDADRSHNSGTGSRRTERTTRECTYTDFLKCQPMNFKGTKGVVGLTQWFERIETVININNCAVENQVKFATCTLYGITLTWWKSMSRQSELALLCGRMFFEESDKIEKYVDGLPDMIHGSVMASKPKTMQDAVEVYTAGPEEKKPHGGSKPLCSKCTCHHDGHCAPKCHKCNRVGHLTPDCRSPADANNQRNLTCYECGNQGHYRSDCPKLKNKNHGNQAGGTRACGMVHALGGGETNQDLNNMEDDINA
nr:hypothetical protein [Tanacetum cinerariifolium]GFB66934.1 hypothetical protein [Tanacetum cinerariifolium]